MSCGEVSAPASPGERAFQISPVELSLRTTLPSASTDDQLTLAGARRSGTARLAAPSMWSSSRAAAYDPTTAVSSTPAGCAALGVTAGTAPNRLSICCVND